MGSNKYIDAFMAGRKAAPAAEPAQPPAIDADSFASAAGELHAKAADVRQSESAAQEAVAGVESAAEPAAAPAAEPAQPPSSAPTTRSRGRAGGK